MTRRSGVGVSQSCSFREMGRHLGGTAFSKQLCFDSYFLSQWPLNSVFEGGMENAILIVLLLLLLLKI